MPCQRCNQERSRDRGPWCAEEGAEPNESLAQCHYASVATLGKVYDRLAPRQGGEHTTGSTSLRNPLQRKL